MSQNSIAVNTGRQLMINTDLTKTFVYNNRYETVDLLYENATDGDVTIPEGTVLGRVLTSQKVVPWTSGASDGSQFPVGVLATDITVLYGETFDGNTSMCVAGDVETSKLGLQGSDTLATECGSSGRSLQDMLASVSGGIRLVTGEQNTMYDNYQ